MHLGDCLDAYCLIIFFLNIWFKVYCLNHPIEYKNKIQKFTLLFVVFFFFLASRNLLPIIDQEQRHLGIKFCE